MLNARLQPLEDKSRLSFSENHIPAPATITTAKFSRVLAILSIAYQLALTVVMKNWDPLESGPEFTMETTPATKQSVVSERGSKLNLIKCESLSKFLKRTQNQNKKDQTNKEMW